MRKSPLVLVTSLFFALGCKASVKANVNVSTTDVDEHKWETQKETWNAEKGVKASKKDDPATLEVAKAIPKVKALLLLKQTLIEMQGNIDNRKEFRNLLRSVASDDKAIASLADELKGFETLKLPKKSGAAS